MKDLLDTPQFSVAQPEKEARLTAELTELHRYHSARCPEYERLSQVLFPGFREAERLRELPYIPVSLFKSHRLVSVPEDQIFKTLTSSGTTGRVSHVYLDRETAQLQASALTKIMTSVLGGKRLPMIIVDTPSVLKDRKQFSARGAGLLGMMNFGYKHFYALDDEMQLNRAGLDQFVASYGDQPFLMFGFTFMVWQYLVKELGRGRTDLRNGILVHSGGWKKLQDEAVGSREFKEGLRAATGVSRSYNFYGMVEQIGSVFVEGDDGDLYCPNFADVVMRRPETWEEAEIGEEGVIEVLSVLPRSYPGHSLLTEDLGVVHGIDDSPSGRLGKRFSVIGRVPRSEMRGCSDTFTASRPAGS